MTNVQCPMTKTLTLPSPGVSGEGKRGVGCLVNHGEDIVLAHDDQLFTVELDFGAGVAGEDDFVALLDAEGGALAGFEAAAVADRQDLATLGLFLGGVGKDDAGF